MLFIIFWPNFGQENTNRWNRQKLKTLSANGRNNFRTRVKYFGSHLRAFEGFFRCLKMFYFRKVVLLPFKQFHGLHGDLKIIHPHPYKRTGEKLDGRPILEQDRTGDNFLVFLKGKHWEKRGKFPEKTGRATQKGAGGRARLKYRPSFYTGGGCINLYRGCRCQEPHMRKNFRQN